MYKYNTNNKTDEEEKCALQALPGSRLTTTLLKEWLLQHLASLHSYQSHVAAAEAASRRNRHAAAAAAAVRAVQRSLQGQFQDEEDSSDSLPKEATAAASDPSQILQAWDAAVGSCAEGLPAQLVDAAAAAASVMATGAVPVQNKHQVRCAWRRAVYTVHPLHYAYVGDMCCYLVYMLPHVY